MEPMGSFQPFGKTFGLNETFYLYEAGLFRICLARWRSGYAEACKALHTGSIPVRASIDRTIA